MFDVRLNAGCCFTDVSQFCARSSSIPCRASSFLVYTADRPTDPSSFVPARSYFTVVGALFSLIISGRMSMFDTLLVVWGMVKEGILEKPATIDPKKVVYIYPTMMIALICALCSMKSDAKESSRTAKVQPNTKSLKNSMNSKLK
ncbi:hypothetical protein KSP40_PGU021964 [Platanthera guangdongensis]|uniref:Uncharacterized protein n=1 Tax=Platanthera guangdongensis TaxID=2320717 RepID=A0ABR2LHN6_9ASPA